MKSPNPKVMRAVFNDPKALRRISDIMSQKNPDDNRTITVDGKNYTVKTSADIQKTKD
jgi:hypothetical protein